MDHNAKRGTSGDHPVGTPLQVGSKTKVYDSRMEKFCEAQLPRLPPDWRRSFVTWWHQVRNSGGGGWLGIQASPPPQGIRRRGRGADWDEDQPPPSTELRVQVVDHTNVRFRL